MNFTLQNLKQARRDIALANDNTKRAGLIQRMHANGQISDGEAQRLIAQYGLTVNDFKASNQTRNADVREFLAPHQANAYDTGAMVGLGNLGLRQELQPYKIDNLQASTQQKINSSGVNIGNVQAVKGQLDRFVDMFDSVAGDKASALTSYAKTNAGFGGKNEVNFNAQRTLLFNKIARDLGGEKGVLSDQDMKRIELALPTLGDSKEQKQAKIQAVYGLINDRVNQYNQMNGGYTMPQSGTTKSGLKYKVIN